MRLVSLFVGVAVALALAAVPARADGELQSSEVELPKPQPSVVVTVERGVRVWRPVGGASDAGSASVAAAEPVTGDGAGRALLGSDNGTRYALPGYGYGFGIAGKVGRNGDKGHGRYQGYNGYAPGVGGTKVHLVGPRFAPQGAAPRGRNIVVHMPSPRMHAPAAHGGGMKMAHGGMGGHMGGGKMMVGRPMGHGGMHGGGRRGGHH
jgi:hypothetical protein